MNLLPLFLLIDILCGTGAAPDRVLPKVQRAAVVDEHTTRFANDFLFVRADDETVAFDDPNDLEGISLHFRRRDAQTFEVTRGPLAYDDDPGALLEAFGRNTFTREVPLPFAFPFGAQSYERLVLSVTRGIHFAADPAFPSHPFTAAEMLVGEQPLLAPHLDYFGSHGTRPDVFAKQSATSLTLTWRSQGPAVAPFDVQAVLHANGDFSFHYKTIAKLAWGGVVVRTGSDSWRSERTPLTSANDAAGDADTSWGSAAPMLDITRVDVARIGGSSVVEVRIRVAEAIDRRTIPQGVIYRLFLGDSLNRVELAVFSDDLLYRFGNSPDILTNSSLGRIEGNEVTIYVPEELLVLDSRTNRLTVQTGGAQNADELSMTLDLGPPAPSGEIDFSAIDTLTAAKPLVETFRLGHVDVAAVWDRLKREFGYSDADIDAVAIYSSFYSDLITSPYGAFATFSNPGADGVSPTSDADAPKTATLLNMNALDFGVNTTPRDRTALLLHEFGHRWLYYFTIRENGADSRSLNPVGPHPAAYVHTPAAFDGESSAMGGAHFLANADGSLNTGSVAKLGYSWHELYLMGLASQSEVQPWFYLADTSLPEAYWPSPNQNVRGTRRDVEVRQLVDSMGPRRPAYPDAQRTFRVLFVILERAGAPASGEAAHRLDFEDAFRKATGGRGEVVTAVSTAPPSAAFEFAAPSTFIDRSTNTPLAWQWSFGDGTTSTARNPQHAYASAGTYTVTLTVTNGRGTSTSTRDVTIEGKPRRRAADR